MVLLKSQGSLAAALPAAILNAVIVAAVVAASSFLGILTRPGGMLAAFWPANAVLLGVMIRQPALAGPAGWLGAVAGYFLADLAVGGRPLSTLLLTCGNLAGVVTGYLLFKCVDAEDRLLRRPLSVLYLASILVIAAAAAGAIGMIANPVLFNGGAAEGWIFWFATELVNYMAILPVILTMPDLARLPPLRRPALDITRTGPLLALIASLGAGMVIGGPGAVCFPVPALLWCALTYSLFATTVITLLFSMSMLLAISAGYVSLGADLHGQHALMSLRVGVTLIALAPVVVASVMAARNQLLERLEQRANIDHLTGTLNRSGFSAQAGNVLARTAAAGRPAAVLMLDIDDFKAINDTYGHAAGDKVLTVFAKRIADCLRDTDVHGRVGGEEFAIVLPDCGRSQAEAIGERIRTACGQAAIALPDGPEISATISIGLAFAPSLAGFTELSPLLDLADKALYRAKQGGKNRLDVTEYADAAPTNQA